LEDERLAVLGRDQVADSRNAFRGNDARELKELNQQLEQRVAERTAALTEANTALERALGEVERLKDRLQRENRYLQDEIRSQHNFTEMIGEHSGLEEVMGHLNRVAATDTSVLILGETGTGKELIARAIHDRSPRAARPLVKVNCAALPGELIESEFFGHEKGAFTGATAQRKGRFELAHGGTIFLDEVGELSAQAQAQAKLLRVLQEQTFERVGGTKSLHTDIRGIAATNRDLSAMVAEGKFRAGLFYRLNVFPILVPPLRERRGDIEHLATFFLNGFVRKLGKPIARRFPDALARLERYPWPGNVRELQNVIERAAILAQDSELEIDDAMLGQHIGMQPSATTGKHPRRCQSCAHSRRSGAVRRQDRGPERCGRRARRQAEYAPLSPQEARDRENRGRASLASSGREILAGRLNLETAVDRFVWPASDWFADGFEETRD